MNAVLSPQSLAPPASPAIAALRADGLVKIYGSITVLSDVTLDIRAGEVHAIIGENGAGKSTLMKLLSGHVAPTAGHLLIEGEPVEF
ncbi:ABC transporter ATP-binding protein, partial [Sinorhizobium medicae]